MNTLRKIITEAIIGVHARFGHVPYPFGAVDAPKKQRSPEVVMFPPVPGPLSSLALLRPVIP